MQSTLDQLLPLDAAAEVLQLAPATLRRWLRQGRIQAHRLSLPTDLGDRALPAPYFRVGELLAGLGKETA